MRGRVVPLFYTQSKSRLCSPKRPGAVLAVLLTEATTRTRDTRQARTAAGWRFQARTERSPHFLVWSAKFRSWGPPEGARGRGGGAGAREPERAVAVSPGPHAARVRVGRTDGQAVRIQGVEGIREADSGIARPGRGSRSRVF